MPKINKLTVKQEKFVNEVIKGQSYWQAALNAGYSPQTANNASRDILENATVTKELSDRLGEQGIDAGYVLENLKRDVDYSEEPNPVRTKSLELMGRHLGLFDRNGTAGEKDAHSLGMPPERREALFKDVLALHDGADNAWPWLKEFKQWLEKLPDDLRKEVDQIFAKSTFADFMFKAPVELITRLHILGEEYRRRVPCGHCGQTTIRGV